MSTTTVVVNVTTDLIEFVGGKENLSGFLQRLGVVCDAQWPGCRIETRHDQEGCSGATDRSAVWVGDEIDQVLSQELNRLFAEAL